MADTKPKAAKRGISKARLLNAVEATCVDYQLTGLEPISDLIEAMKDDIVKEAQAKA